MLEPEVFRKQMWCIEQSTGDNVGIFRRPLQWFDAREIVCPPRYALVCAVLGWNLAQQFTSWVTPVVIKQTSEKCFLLLIHVSLSVLIKYGTGFTIALEVDDKSLDVESHSLMSVNRQKRTSPSHFLRNPTFGVISTAERLLSMPQIKGRKKDFLKFLVQPTCGCWTYLLV